MCLFRFFVVLSCFFSLPCFSEKNQGIGFMNDVSFQKIRTHFTLDELQAKSKEIQHIQALIRLMTAHNRYHSLKKAKSWIFDFLVLNPSFQKKVISKAPKLIPLGINETLSVQNVSLPAGDDFLKRLPASDILAVMPHLFLALADENIIERVFSTPGFDPYLKTSIGNNLFHSFILLHWINKVIGHPVKIGDYREGLYFLIKKAPSELLEQKNDAGATPALLAVHLNDEAGYLILLEAMKPEHFSREISILEDNILSRGFYHLLQPLYKIQIKLGLTHDMFVIDKKGAIFQNQGNALEVSHRSKKEKAPFVVFKFDSLIKRGFGFLDDFLKATQGNEESRESALFEIFGAVEDPFLRLEKEIYLAVFNKDIVSLKRAFETMPQNEYRERTASTILEESIRIQFTEGVQFAIDAIQAAELEWSAYPPVSFALLNYATLRDNTLEKQEAKKIIRILSSKKEEAGELIEYDSLFWSVFFGLFDELKYFVEEKGFFAKIDNPDPFIWHLMSYAEQQDFMVIYKYLQKRIEKNSELSCEQIFLK